MSILGGADNIAALFRSSRNLSSDRWLVQILVHAFGISVEDSAFYLSDRSGLGNQPSSPETGAEVQNPDHRIFYLTYKSFHQGLNGAPLAEMVRQLVKNVADQIRDFDLPDGDDTWTEVSDLYGDVVRKMAFEAAVMTMCGPHIFRLSPSLADDFWAFDRHLPSLTREIPRWLSPASYRAREKMKLNIRRWQEFAHTNYDVSQGKEDQREWEEFFGSRLMRTRHDNFRKMPLSPETRAAEDLGLIWAYVLRHCRCA